MQTKGENQSAFASPSAGYASAGRAAARAQTLIPLPRYHWQVRLSVKLPKAGSRRFDAVGFGLNTTDILAIVDGHPGPGTKGPIQDLAIRPGGQAATAMTACSRLGWAARYVGRFGDDPNGVAGRESLLEAGVDIAACETMAGATNALSLVLVDASTGQRTVLWSRHPSLTMTPARVSAAAVCSGRVLLVDCHDTAAATVAAKHAREEGIPTVVDVEKVRPGIESLLQEIDVIITAQDFPTQLTGRAGIGAALGAMRTTFRASLVCATLGEEGSLAATDEGEIRTPGFSVDVVDTTGAGDVFRGGFISGWLLDGENAEIEDLLRYANAVAALKCRALGARGGIPTRDEVNTLLM